MRPKVICHMTSSIDGRQLLDRWSKPASGIAPDLLGGYYEQTYRRLGADGWIVGRKTMQYYADEQPPLEAAEPCRPVDFTADRRGRNLAVAVDLHGRLHYRSDEVDGDHVVAILGPGVAEDYLQSLRAVGVSYVFAGDDGRQLGRALEAIGDAFNVGCLSLQGGGTINGVFLNAGLIDEISVLIYPGIDGLSGVASIFDYPGDADERPAAGRSLRHLSTETFEGGTVWVRYQVEPEPQA